MSRSTLAQLAFCAAVSAPASAQISHPGVPASEWAPLPIEVPTAHFETPDIANALAEDAARGDIPLRYGLVLPAHLSMGEAGRWDIAPDGSQVWRLEIHSAGAYSLGVVFSEYDLQPGMQVFLYDDERTQILGAFDHTNNKSNGMLGIEPVTGDRITVEFVQRPEATGVARLAVGEVIYDYKNVDALLGTGTTADGSCLIDINCPEGAPYQVIKRAAIRTLAGGSLCSAAILNNTAQDGTPYMLTANHCGNMTNGTFRFNYEKTGCGGGSSSFDSLSGATKLASTGLQDSQLYVLSSAIPASHDPYFAGWDRTVAPTTGPAVSIGHGSGLPKQIAIDNNGVSASGNFFTTFWNAGITVGGNSGGPVFDGNQRVIGPACCVNNFTCGAQFVDFGRFQRFWDNHALEQWLDPIGTGQVQLDGLDPSSPTSAPNITAIVPDPVDAVGGGTLQIQGTNMLGITSVDIGSKSYTSTDPLDVDYYQSINSFLVEVPKVLFEDSGSVDVTVTNSFGPSNTVSVTVNEVDPPVFVSPALSLPGSTFHMEWGGEANDTYLVYWATDPSTVDIAGFDVLAAGNFGLSGTLNAGGTDQFVIPSVGSLGFLTVFLQVLTFDDVGGTFVGASNIPSTLFL